jgi:hypothetical protein
LRAGGFHARYAPYDLWPDIRMRIERLGCLRFTYVSGSASARFCRWSRYGFKDVGEVLLLENSSNFAVTDCDLCHLSPCQQIRNIVLGNLRID